MADITDEASSLEELQTYVAIQNQLAAPRLLERKICYNCGMHLPESGLFCDAECRDDYEKIERAKKMVAV
jgi:hypothetical protein